MHKVARYNIFKGVSTLLGVGTPLITLFCTRSSFIYSPAGAVSFTGVVTILLAGLFFKDKIAENWKVTSVFVVSTIIFVSIILLEHILQPMKLVCLTTMIASGIDELTFKRFYKQIEEQLPECSKYHKFIGFMFTTTARLEKESNG